MKPMAAALAGALISGVGMYAIGAHAQDRFAPNPAMSFYTSAPQPAAQPAGYAAQAPAYFAQAPAYFVTTPQPVATPVVERTSVTPRGTTVYRQVETAAPVSQRVETRPHRSLAKTALIVGGSAASGAGVGGLVGGKKGALVGAAIGGGAASIYEATRR